jgi:hypothetical protein
MNKKTKRNKKNIIKNKTTKYFGGKKAKIFEKSRGVFDIIGDTLSSYSGKATNYIKDKSLKLVGLQPIDKEEETQIYEPTKEVSEINKSASGLLSEANEIGADIVKVFDKGTAAVVGNINDVLQSQKIEGSISEAAEETAEIGEKLLDKFNEKLNTPELKEKTTEALKNVSDYTEIVLDSMNEPINKAVDQLNEAGTKAASGAISGLIKVSTDALAAVPGFGAIIELGKIANDASAAVGDVAEAASDATTTISKIVEETSSNIDEELNKLDEKKRQAKQIANRTSRTIETFENPIGKTINKVNTYGGARLHNKTKRKLFKNKAKSKRVRFNI